MLSEEAEPAARSPQPGWLSEEAPRSTIAGPFRARHTKGICSGSVSTVRPFGSWRRVTPPLPAAKNEEGERMLLYTLPDRHAGHNELEKRGPLTGRFQSPALSPISFLSRDLPLFLGFAVNFGLVLEGGGGRLYYLT